MNAFASALKTAILDNKKELHARHNVLTKEEKRLFWEKIKESGIFQNTELVFGIDEDHMQAIKNAYKESRTDIILENCWSNCSENEGKEPDLFQPFIRLHTLNEPYFFSVQQSQDDCVFWNKGYKAVGYIEVSYREKCRVTGRLTHITYIFGVGQVFFDELHRFIDEITSQGK